MELTMTELAELTPEEAARVEGGNYQAAMLLVGAFGAGFNFGFNVLGPRIFG